jgi:hypothetical protein
LLAGGLSEDESLQTCPVTLGQCPENTSHILNSAWMDAPESIRLDYKSDSSVCNDAVVNPVITYPFKPVQAVGPKGNDKFIVLAVPLLCCADVSIAAYRVPM